MLRITALEETQVGKTEANVSMCSPCDLTAVKEKEATSQLLFFLVNGRHRRVCSKWK